MEKIKKELLKLWNGLDLAIVFLFGIALGLSNCRFDLAIFLLIVSAVALLLEVYLPNNNNV